MPASSVRTDTAAEQISEHSITGTPPLPPERRPTRTHLDAVRSGQAQPLQHVAILLATAAFGSAATAALAPASAAAAAATRHGCVGTFGARTTSLYLVSFGSLPCVGSLPWSDEHRNS
jgi:hypothetical protein